MHRLLLLIVVSLAACKEKPKAAPAPTPAAPATAPASVPAPPPVEPVGSAAAAEPAVEPPPSPSEIALGKRAEFFGKVNELSKRAGDDCAKLGTELDKLTAEAREVATLRADVTGAQVAHDEAIVKTSFKSLVRMTSTCPDTAKIDAFLDIVGADPK